MCWVFSAPSRVCATARRLGRGVRLQRSVVTRRAELVAAWRRTERQANNTSSCFIIPLLYTDRLTARGGALGWWRHTPVRSYDVTQLMTSRTASERDVAVRRRVDDGWHFRDWSVDGRIASHAASRYWNERRRRRRRHKTCLFTKSSYFTDFFLDWLYLYLFSSRLSSSLYPDWLIDW